MIKLLALDMDGTLLNEAKEIPQAHIDAIHKAIEKGVKLVLCTGRPLFGVLPYYKKLGLDLENEYVIVNNGCSTHQTSDWGLVDWRELSKSDIEYLNDLAEKSEVQLTIFDEEHYFVLGGKPKPGGNSARSTSCIDDKQRSLNGAHCRIGVAYKVRIARRVKHVNTCIFPGNWCDSGRDRESAL